MPPSAALTLESPASMAAEYMNGIKVISEGLDSSTSGMTLHEKQRLLSATKQLVDKLEGPETGNWKVVFGLQENAALRSAIEIRIFEVFEDNNESVNADQLARQTGAEKLLLGAAAKLVSFQFPLSDVLNCGTKNSEELQEENVLVVDVGGGRGKVLNDLRMARPDLQGGMIVQDLPKEIDGREPTPGIRSMTHDFFTPQPIKGAYTYFFRHIFHDWPGNACIKILQQTIPAMQKGYSRILIADSVLPDMGASVFGSLLDINMMPLSGIERTEKHWKKLLEGEGLKVVNIQWPDTSGGSRDCVLEAVLE
ncbi:hypothetical protein BOTCAL_0010g00370 [Botryotinia calthae]|uniref:O-methyltransferase C-terminal domain-containing protein n=1 Tax=Botryotinia calthae TaxID=38488 RepID=A0A4Y8DIQ4_9HELO|nr:hypothetical protein BOTCAL_0010g00370 [Botryotinia calthae]